MSENRDLHGSDQTKEEVDFDHSAVELKIMRHAETIGSKRIVIHDLLISVMVA